MAGYSLLTSLLIMELHPVKRALCLGGAKCALQIAQNDTKSQLRCSACVDMPLNESSNYLTVP